MQRHCRIGRPEVLAGICALVGSLTTGHFSDWVGHRRARRLPHHSEPPRLKPASILPAQNLADARWIREERGRTGWLRAVHERPSPPSPARRAGARRAVQGSRGRRGARAAGELPAATLQTHGQRAGRETEPPTNLNDKILDTSAVEATKGKDIQGIPWERYAITREKYRQVRIDKFKNYESIPNSGEAAAKECRHTEKGGTYYEFIKNTKSVKSTILHFQLRNLVWATSKHDVYLLSHYSILHWSALSGADTELINLQGLVVPRENYPGNLLEGFSQIPVSTLAVKDNFLVAGGFQGELICKHLDREGISFCCRTTFDNNAIINAVDIFDTSSGSVHFMASSNDSSVRDYDMDTFQLCKHFQFDWPVNHASVSPDGKLVVVVGDNPDGLLIDANSGKTLHSMKGHHDYSFASAWNPDGRTFATGNQDKTCRIWDARNLSKAIHVLKGNLGAIRSIRFTSDGQFLSMAEAADFVHIFDVQSDYNKRQELDFFGEISGMSFSPDTDALFVSVWDRTYPSVLQFSRLYNCQRPRPI